MGRLGAQDLLLPISGDSINCRIVGKDREGVHYDYSYEGQLQHAYMRVGDIRSIKKGFFDEGFGGSVYVRDLRGFPYLFADLELGIGWHTGSPLDDRMEWPRDEHGELQTARHASVVAHYLLTKHWGLGAVISVAHFPPFSDSITFFVRNKTNVTGALLDPVRTFFVGPSCVYTRTLANGRTRWYAGGSIGYMRYTSQAFVEVPMDLVGNTYGVQLQARLDHRFGEHFGVGISVVRILSTLTYLKVVDDPDNWKVVSGDRLELYRLDIGLGLSYTL